MLNIKIKRNFQRINCALTSFVLLAIVNISYADDDLQTDGICKTLATIETILTAVSVIVVTIAVMWAGYKFLFTRADVGECGKILVAGVMIGSASTIAGWFMGKSNGCADELKALNPTTSLQNDKNNNLVNNTYFSDVNYLS